LNGLSFQIVEREFRDLDEVLIWVDRNQLGRRNLTDEQRTIVIGRLYKTVKQNPILNLKQFQTDNGDRVLNLSTREGSAATARAIAEQVGVGQATVRRAEKFADAVEALQEVSLQAAERILRGEVRDALTELPEVPKEALSFVAKELEEGARSIKQILMEWRQQQKEQRLKERSEVTAASANFQRRPARWTVAFALLIATPDNRRCSRSQAQTDGKERRALQALNDDRLRLPFPSRAQLTDLPKRAHSFGAFAANTAQVIQTSTKERQFAPFLNEPLPTRFVPNRFQFATPNGALNGHPRAIEPSRQRVRRQSHVGHPKRIHNNLNNAIQPTQPCRFCRAAKCFVLLGFLQLKVKIASLCRNRSWMAR
jgi:hypothetical protein